MKTLCLLIMVLGVFILLIGIGLGLCQKEKRRTFAFAISGIALFFVFELLGAGMIKVHRDALFAANYPTNKYKLSYEYISHDNTVDTIIVIKEKEE